LEAAAGAFGLKRQDLDYSDISLSCGDTLKIPDNEGRPSPDIDPAPALLRLGHSAGFHNAIRFLFFPFFVIR